MDGRPAGGGASAVHYIEPDHLGTPRSVVEAQRDAVVWRWDLLGEPFGLGLPNADADGDGVSFILPLRFPGQYYDVETGLHYNYFRDYEPGTGRYVQSDPIGLVGGISTYAYAGQSPIGNIDYYGLWSMSLDLYKGVGGGVTFGRSKETGRCFYLDAWGLD